MTLSIEEAETMFPGSTVQLDWEAKHVVDEDNRFELFIQDRILKARSETVIPLNGKFSMLGAVSFKIYKATRTNEAIWVQVEGEWHWSKTSTVRLLNEPHDEVWGPPRILTLDAGAGTYLYMRHQQTVQETWFVKRVGDSVLVSPTNWVPTVPITGSYDI